MEIIGVASVLVYLWGITKQKVWAWPAGILSVLCYACIVFYEKLYGEFGLQFIYLGLSVYGWVTWSSAKHKREQRIKNLSLKALALVMGIGIVLSTSVYPLLVSLGNDYPVWDALTTGFSLVTTYLVAKRYIENWFFWVIIDCIYAVIFALKGYSFYSMQYAGMSLYCLYGYYQWKEQRKISP